MRMARTVQCAHLPCDLPAHLLVAHVQVDQLEHIHLRRWIVKGQLLTATACALRMVYTRLANPCSDDGQLMPTIRPSTWGWTAPNVAAQGDNKQKVDFQVCLPAAWVDA